MDSYQNIRVAKAKTPQLKKEQRQLMIKSQIEQYRQQSAFTEGNTDQMLRSSISQLQTQLDMEARDLRRLSNSSRQLFQQTPNKREIVTIPQLQNTVSQLKTELLVMQNDLKDRVPRQREEDLLAEVSALKQNSNLMQASLRQAQTQAAETNSLLKQESQEKHQLASRYDLLNKEYLLLRENAQSDRFQLESLQQILQNQLENQMTSAKVSAEDSQAKAQAKLRAETQQRELETANILVQQKQNQIADIGFRVQQVQQENTDLREQIAEMEKTKQELADAFDLRFKLQSKTIEDMRREQLKIVVLQQQHTVLQQQINSLEADNRNYARSQGDQSALKQLLDQTRSEADQYKTEALTLRQKLQAANSQISNYTRQNSQLQDRVSEKQMEHQDTLKILQKEREEGVRLQETIASTQKQLEFIRAELKTTQATSCYRDVEISQLKSQKEQLNTEIQLYIQKLNICMEKNDSLQQQLTQAETQIGSQHTQIHELQQAIKDGEDRNSRIQQVGAEILREKADAEEEIQKLTWEIERLKTEQECIVKQAQRETVTLTKQESDWKRKLSELEINQQCLKDKLKSQEDLKTQMQSQLDKRQADIVNLRRMIQELKIKRDDMSFKISQQDTKILKGLKDVNNREEQLQKRSQQLQQVLIQLSAIKQKHNDFERDVDNKINESSFNTIQSQFKNMDSEVDVFIKTFNTEIVEAVNNLEKQVKEIQLEMKSDDF